MSITKCKLCGADLAYPGALFCGAGCSARWEGGERPPSTAMANLIMTARRVARLQPAAKARTAQERDRYEAFYIALNEAERVEALRDKDLDDCTVTERQSALDAFRKIASMVEHDSPVYLIAAEEASALAYDQKRASADPTDRERASRFYEEEWDTCQPTRTLAALTKLITTARGEIRPADYVRRNWIRWAGGEMDRMRTECEGYRAALEQIHRGDLPAHKIAGDALTDLFCASPERCIVDVHSSRVCESGTKSCTVSHEASEAPAIKCCASCGATWTEDTLWCNNCHKTVARPGEASPGWAGFTDEKLVAACKNIGFDLTCGACAMLFYTGYTGPTSRHDAMPSEHTCAPRRETEKKP